MPIAAIVLIALIALLVSGFNLTGTARLDPNLTQDTYNSLFVNLGIIAVILERFIEVFNSIWRRAGKVDLQLTVDAATTPAARVPAQKALDDYRAKTGTYAMYGGFVMGLVAAIAGIHILQVLYDVQALTDWQKILFRATDVVLTAGLLAGGSKGVNAVTAVFGNLLDSSANRARDAGRPTVTPPAAATAPPAAATTPPAAATTPPAGTGTPTP